MSDLPGQAFMFRGVHEPTPAELVAALEALAGLVDRIDAETRGTEHEGEPDWPELAAARAALQAAGR